MKDTRISRKPVFPVLGVWMVVGILAPAAVADQLVNFKEGRSLVVKSSEKRGEWYHLVLEGGGELGVPVNRVASIEEYEPPPPGVARSNTANQVTASAPAPAPPATQNSAPSPAARNLAQDSEAGGVDMTENSAAPPPSPNGGLPGGPASVGDWRTKTRSESIREAAQGVGATGRGRPARGAGRRLGYHPRKPPKGDN